MVVAIPELPVTITLDWFQDVLDFHKAMNCHIGTYPKSPPNSVIRLRNSLEIEELQELGNAISRDDIPEVADAIADLIYVLIGRAITYGIDLRPIWAAIHKANMEKVNGAVRPDGKRLKPQNWKHPDIRNILKNQPSLNNLQYKPI